MADDTHIDLRQTVAALRQQLEARTAERDEALAREAALAEVLQNINSSPGDLTPVFDAILEKAHSLCGVEHGALVTYDGEYFRSAADHGMPQFWIKHIGSLIAAATSMSGCCVANVMSRSPTSGPLQKPCKVVPRSGPALARS